MDSDSDKTIDSDELEEIIAKAKAEQSSSNPISKKKSLKRHSAVHYLSDSDSDDGIKVKKREILKPTKSENSKERVKADDRPVCQYGSKCYRKNPEHKKQFFHPGYHYHYYVFFFQRLVLFH